MSATPEISVVIPTRGRPETLGVVLARLFEQRFDADRLEIIVVVDGPDPATESLLEQLAATAPSALRWVRQPKSGQGMARNRGIEQARGRVVLMLDDDILACPELITEHARHHAGRDDRVVTGALPVEALPDEPAHQQQIRLWWDGELEAKASPSHQASFRDFVTGNVSVPRARLLAVGGFDPAFAGYGREDYELGHRLLLAGLEFVYEPRAIGVHRYTKPVLDWMRQWRSMGRADVIFARKHPELMEEVMGLSAFPYVRWSPLLVGAAERVASLLNVRGGYLWSRSAAFAIAAHYWRGVADAVEGPAELRHLRATRARLRRTLRRPNLIRRILLKRLRLEPV